LAVKARPSTFDALVGRRSSSFDTIAVLPGNRPMESPAVVEEVGPGLSDAAGEGTQAQCSRCTRGRFFGLRLRLPRFGAKDEGKRAGPPAISATSGGWRHCQTASDLSDDEGGRAQRLAEARARLIGQHGPGPRSPMSADSVSSQCPNRSAAFPVPLYPGTHGNSNRPQGYIRKTRSLDAPNSLRSGDQFGIVHRCPKAPNLVTVEESQDQASPGSRSKEKWTERASRQFSSVASRFRRKGERRHKAGEGKAVKGHVSVEHPEGYRAENQADLDRRKSIGAAMGRNCDAYDTPGPEGPRCPPDNLYIPSGPPDSVYIPAGDDSQSLSVSMDSCTAQLSMVANDPRVDTAAPVYASSYSHESGYVLSAPLAIWDHDATIDQQSDVTGATEGMEGADFSQTRINVVVCQPEGAVDGYCSGAVDPDLGEAMLSSEVFQGRGLDVSRSGQQLPPGQSPASSRAPAEWQHESGPHTTCVLSSDVGGASTPSRSRKPARLETMARKIFGDSSGKETAVQLCPSADRTDSWTSFIESEGGPEPKPMLRLQTALSEGSQEVSPHNVFTEAKLQLPALRVPSRCTPEMPLPPDDHVMVDSLDCWNKFQRDDGAKSVARSVTQSEYDDSRPPMRPSICLSDKQSTLPSTRPESEPTELERLAGNCSAASFRRQVNLNITTSYCSDGPLYHRSMFYQSGFSSREESSDDGDDGSRCTPSQFVLQLKPKYAHRRWHSDCLHGISAVRDNYVGTCRSQSHYSLCRRDRLSDILSDYTRSYDGYPARPGYSFRSGLSDLVLPEFRSFRDWELYGHADRLRQEKKPRKSWLDELQETADLRRKECTYRIACQRAILENMKENLQASKLAFDRIKSGLCPQLTSGVAELRRRWGGKRRVQRRQKLAIALKQEEDEIWDDFPLRFEDVHHSQA